MIIRILTEGQYRLEGDALVELDRLDDYLLDAVSAGNEADFHHRLHDVVAVVKEKGEQLPASELVESELILPPSDTTFAEARELFADYPRHLTKEANSDGSTL